MRSTFAAFVLVLLTTGALAKDVMVPISEQEMQTWPNVPMAVEQCVSGLQLKGDATICKQLFVFVSAFLVKLEAAKQAPRLEKQN